MSYYWAMAGQWMASTLRSTAEAHLARAAAIRTGAQSIGALRPPVWTGRAAQTERADREAMTARMDRTTQVLEGYGRLAATRRPSWQRSKLIGQPSSAS